jgi:Na+/proline symporter
MTPDMLNGFFELLGSLMLWSNVRRLYIDKQTMGINGWTVGFFTSWGIWNLFYYPNLNQWYSFAGGVSIVIANTAWLILLLYYKNKKSENEIG